MHPSGTDHSQQTMTTFEIIFWLSFAVIFYSYIGYGALLIVLVSIKKAFKKSDKNKSADYFPQAALVVAAYNEKDFIREKIMNSLELDYPSDRLELIFITDGSSDETPDIIREYPQIKLLHQPERRGKVAAMNRAVEHVSSPLIIFCDANTLLNKACIREIVKHYQDRGYP